MFFLHSCGSFFSPSITFGIVYRISFITQNIHIYLHYTFENLLQLALILARGGRWQCMLAHSRACTHILTCRDKKRHESICKMLESNERHSDVLLFTLFFIFRTQFRFFSARLFVFQFESFMQHTIVLQHSFFYSQIVLFSRCLWKGEGTFLAQSKKILQKCGITCEANKETAKNRNECMKCSFT